MAETCRALAAGPERFWFWFCRCRDACNSPGGPGWTAITTPVLQREELTCGDYQRHSHAHVASDGRLGPEPQEASDFADSYMENPILAKRCGKQGKSV